MSSDERNLLIRITLPHACFGLVSERGKITEAAPIARWSLGRRTVSVLKYWKKRGATVQAKEL